MLTQFSAGGHAHAGQYKKGANQKMRKYYKIFAQVLQLLKPPNHKKSVASVFTFFSAHIQLLENNCFLYINFLG